MFYNEIANNLNIRDERLRASYTHALVRKK